MNKNEEKTKKLPLGKFGPMGKGRGIEKPKNFKQSLKKLMAVLKPYLPAIIISLVLAIVSTIFVIVGPNKLKEITDIIGEGMFTGINLEKIGKIGIFLVSIYSLGWIFSFTLGYIMTTVNMKMLKKLRHDISHKINLLPFGYFDRTSTGDILSRVTNDADTIGQTLSESIVTIISSVALLLGSVIMMFVTNYIMAIAAIVSSLLGIVVMLFVMKKSQKHFVAQQLGLGQINGHISEVFSNHNVVKVFNGEKQVEKEFSKINDSLYSSAWKSQFLSGLMMPLMNFVGNLGYVVVCVVGAVLVLSGHISFGVIVAFMLYVRLFTQPLSQLSQGMTSLQSAAAASERVFEFLEEKEVESETEKTKKICNCAGNVEFKNVQFGYVQNKTIIKDFSAKVASGQKVAIVGPTGAGKTTIVNLLMRFYEISGGSILIDGIPISEISRDEIHNLFGMVLQDTWLFEGTVKENVVFNKENAGIEDVIKACEAVGIDHFIKTLPQGYDTVLCENTSISAGQKQLLTIARAMVQNSPMLILDEATSSVDTRTEILIQQAMDKITIGRTSFVIAHRLSTIKNADMILVLKDGDIIETGNHEELLAQNGFYAELYNSQFSDK